MGSVSKYEMYVKPASVTPSLDECVHMRTKCGLCDGSVRKKSCIQYGTATTKSSLYTSAEGGPQPRRGGGEAKKVAELFEGTRKLKRDGRIKIVPGNIPPLSSPFKNSTSSEHKNSYKESYN